MGRGSPGRRTWKPVRLRRPGALELRAYHEAGHAVAAVLRGFALARVSILRRGEHGGACEYVGEARFHLRAAGVRAVGTPGRVLQRIARSAASVALAGSVAQDAIALEHGYIALDQRTGRPFPLFSAGAEADEQSARAMASRLYGRGPGQREFLRRMRTTTERLLGSREAWRAVNALARALLRAGCVEGARAERIIAAALCPRRGARAGLARAG